ncbi:type II secretion system F family protein [Frondihabitans sp. Leaf304]|uniref:type II secretion system F family protein n=1 Tax=Frondihabitans sp. Leaf304 TaxID=1736329 RepID=UPI000A00AD62|nr:type II secretion system F family protein [Frondihabitans sp. Leaf304]
MSRRAHGPGSSTSGASAVRSLERLAVLLEAGIAPAAAWRHLAESTLEPDERRILALTADSLRRGLVGSAAISSAWSDARAPVVARAQWLQAAAAWEVAEASGAPLAHCLRSSAESARVLVQARRDARVAASGPVATARIVLALPAFGILVALGLGIDTVRVLALTSIGWVCVGGAGALVLAARAWNRRLLSAAAPPDGIPGLDLELIALAMQGGGAWGEARARVSAALERHCAGLTIPTAAAEIDALVTLSENAGVPAGGLLRSAADELRRDSRARAEEASERLGVRLMLPLGVCILPAFLLVGVVPLMVALLASTGPIG